jgi:uncharacterized protein DUF6644
MLFNLCQWIQTTSLCTAIRESSDVYPIILTCHLAGLAIFGGMLMMSDMRLLGFALTDFPVSQIVGRLRVWKRIGLLIMLTMGVLLFSAKAADYYANPWFRAKIVLLLMTGVHALVFRGSVYSRTLEFDHISGLPATAKTAAWLSLGLWTTIVVCGRAIGYYEIPGAP